MQHASTDFGEWTDAQIKVGIESHVELSFKLVNAEILRRVSILKCSRLDRGFLTSEGRITMTAVQESSW